MIIGITGKSGVGKSTYANKIAKDFNMYVIHIDEISHKIMELPNVKENLIKTFGTNVIQNGLINRKYLGDMIFTNRHLYEEMNDIVWQEMKHEIDRELQNHENIVLDWILLPHSHYWKLCDKKVLITADERQRREKVMLRDNISEEYLDKRDSASIDYDDIKFDEIITNTYEEQWG